MYLFLDQEKIVSHEEIIGIFDLDKTTVRADTRDFLNNAEKNGTAVTLNIEELPLSFAVTEKNVYISSVAAGTLAKRLK